MYIILVLIAKLTVINELFQYSFPGGLSEDGDCSPVATALREAEEELGISPNQVEIWGQLPAMPDRVRSGISNYQAAVVRDM